MTAFAAWTIICIGAGVFPAQAGQWKGMDIVQYCTGDTVLFDDTTCRAYIQGVIDAHERFNRSEKQPATFCLPQNKDEREKGESLVPKWLATFKERWTQEPIVLIGDALKDIFPCRERAR